MGLFQAEGTQVWLEAPRRSRKASVLRAGLAERGLAQLRALPLGAPIRSGDNRCLRLQRVGNLAPPERWPSGLPGLLLDGPDQN